MATIKLSNGQSIEAEDGKRLVLAIEDAGIDILHRCGGFARCTTCRVRFDDGEPSQMTQAEKEKLSDQGNLGKFRLSCQIACQGNMQLEVLMTVTSENLDDPGNRPEDSMTPDPVWVSRD